MDPETLKLILFAEQLAVLAAKSIADVRSIISGSNDRAVADILDDADKTYNEIIARAKA